MSGFEVGLVVMGSIWMCNSVTENIMKKIYKNNLVEIDRLKIPIYPIISWIKFRMKLKQEKEQEEQEKKERNKTREKKENINNDNDLNDYKF